MPNAHIVSDSRGVRETPAPLMQENRLLGEADEVKARVNDSSKLHAQIREQKKAKKLAALKKQRAQQLGLKHHDAVFFSDPSRAMWFPPSRAVVRERIVSLASKAECVKAL